MVEKRKKIGRKPAKPTVDDFVAGGDSEQLPVPQPAPQPAAKPKGKIHRISLDVDGPLYKALKMAALEAEKPMVELIREVLSDRYLDT